MNAAPTPARYRRAVFFLVDGARADVLHALLAAGELPAIARHLGERGTSTVATTAFPSVTVAAYAPFLTGRFPGPANIPGLRWFDPAAYARSPLSLRRVRSYCGPESYLTDGDLDGQSPTLFELLGPSRAVFSSIARGVGVRGNLGLFGRVPLAVRVKQSGDFTQVDELGRRYLRAALQSEGRFVCHVALGVDEYSHRGSPFSERTREAYRQVDRCVGEAAALLARRGELESTLLALSSDHGHATVERHFDLEGFCERRFRRPLFHPRTLRRWLDCDAACMVSGNAMAFLYLRGPAGWGTRVAGDALLAAHPGLVDDLLAEEAIDQVAYRLPDGSIRIRARRGAATVRLGPDGSRRLSYRPDDDGDPFGYPPFGETELTHERLHALTLASAYPDAPLQLAQVFVSPRSGDLVVTASPGWDLRARFESRELRSGHGSLHRDHMLVPFLMSHPVAADGVRTADLFPTVLELLGAPAPAAGRCDGRSLVARPAAVGA